MHAEDTGVPSSADSQEASRGQAPSARNAVTAPVPTLDRKTVLIALGFLILLGAHFRFNKLDLQSLWLDELVSWDTSRGDSLPDVIRKDIRNDVQPPLYFILLHLAQRAFGDSEYVLRLPSAIAGVLAIPVVFLIGRRLYGDVEGLIAAALTSVLWFPIYYSQEVRPYSLLLLVTLTASYFWIILMESLWRKERPRLWPSVACAAGVLACAYTHYFGLYFAALQGLAALAIAAVRRPRSVVYPAAVYGAAAVGYLPWLAQALHVSGKSLSWIPRPDWHVVFGCFRNFFNASLWVVVPALCLYGWLLGRDLYEALTGRREEGASGSALRADLMLALWLVVPIAGMYLISILRTPILWPRYVIFCAPAAYLLAARAITRIPLGERVRAVVGVTVVILLVGHLLFGIRYYAVRTKEQFREAVATVVENDAAYGNSVIIGSGSLPVYFSYYFQRMHSPRRIDLWAAGEKNLPEVMALIDEKRPRYIWFICAHKTPNPAFLDALALRFTARNKKELCGAGVVLFENKPPTAKSP